MTRPIDQRPDGSPPSPAPEAIEARRTARRFDPDRPLPESLLARLIELATLAPSPCNLQPWRFLVVRDPRNRRRLRACTYGDARLTEAPVVLVVLAYRHPDRTDLGAVVDRQLALGAISPEDAARVRATAARTWSRIPDPIRPALMASAALMIAAESLGLASAWIDEIIEEEARRAFGIPDDHALGGLLALGFAADQAPFPGRLGLDQVCFDEYFGLPWEVPQSFEEGSAYFSSLSPWERAGVRGFENPSTPDDPISNLGGEATSPHPGPLPGGEGGRKSPGIPDDSAQGDPGPIDASPLDRGEEPE
ncbi:nitroreductase family protein [Tundrisphaera lichenicola]|uniref:nitroreductase family protein n=1 Tax=Tundrisphaera lichenicola TaxID=2029860 RepID=UPI003EB837C6